MVVFSRVQLQGEDLKLPLQKQMEKACDIAANEATEERRRIV